MWPKTTGLRAAVTFQRLGERCQEDAVRERESVREGAGCAKETG